MGFVLNKLYGIGIALNGLRETQEWRKDCHSLPKIVLWKMTP